MRWRLNLSEFDFEIQYRREGFHHVLDALSSLILPSTDSKSVDNWISTFGDHQDPVIFATRLRNAGKNGPSREQDVPQGRLFQVTARPLGGSYLDT